MKEIKQISIDILTNKETDGEELAVEILKCLESNGYTVAGIDFKEDLTDEYKGNYPEILE